MTDEEKKAIERIYQLTEFLRKWNENYTIIPEDRKYLDIILNLIQKQEKVIDEMANIIVGDEKILALMCKHIINKTEQECDEQNLLCDDCIKQYFYRKVERR